MRFPPAKELAVFKTVLKATILVCVVIITASILAPYSQPDIYRKAPALRISLSAVVPTVSPAAPEAKRVPLAAAEITHSPVEGGWGRESHQESRVNHQRSRVSARSLPAQSPDLGAAERKGTGGGNPESLPIVQHDGTAKDGVNAKNEGSEEQSLESEMKTTSDSKSLQPDKSEAQLSSLRGHSPPSWTPAATPEASGNIQSTEQLRDQAPFFPPEASAAPSKPTAQQSLERELNASQAVRIAFADSANKPVESSALTGVTKPKTSRYDTDGFRRSMFLALNERKGRIEKLPATKEMPFGTAAEENPLCKPFWGKRQIAVVGNGPLSDEQRATIGEADVIFRFNMLNNLKRGQERVDVWMVRFAGEVSHHYWGFALLGDLEAQEILNSTQAVFLLGGRQLHADKILDTWPSIEHGPGKGLLLAEEPIYRVLAKQLDLTEAVPSSGYVAVAAVLHCQPEAELHIYGMNWSPLNWNGHKMDAEQTALARMEAEGKLRIHPTPCSGLRECGGAADIDNSCHWNKDHHYMCLREGKWSDFTFILTPERRGSHQTDRLESRQGSVSIADLMKPQETPPAVNQIQDSGGKAPESLAGWEAGEGGSAPTGTLVIEASSMAPEQVASSDSGEQKAEGKSVPLEDAPAF